MRILCLESGGTKLVAALADESGKLLRRIQRRRAGRNSARETLGELQRMGRELVSGDEIQAVGFGFGGTVSRRSGVPTVCFHEDGWDRLDSRAALEQAFRRPVFIENDCNVAALAEAWARPEGRDRVVLYVTLGTGIGAGLVCGGRLVRLGELGEAEIGHVVVTSQPFPCACGNQGCLEAVCSGPGLSRLASQVAGEAMEAPDLMRRFRAGESAAREVAGQAADYLARALAPAITLFAAQTVVLGGGVMSENGLFLGLIQEKTLPRLFPLFRDRGVDFELSLLKEDVVCTGAAIYALQRLGVLEPD